MNHSFPVTVVDDKGAEVAGATVALVEKVDLDVEPHPFPNIDPTHADSGKGLYKETTAITPSAGEWGLVVNLAGKSTVFQPLKFKAGSGGEFIVSPQPGAVATVTITTAIRKVGADKVKEISFHVTLFPAAEIVFIAGIDFHAADVSKGWLFHDYGFHRAEVLRREKKIHAGTIVTVFSTAKIFRAKKVWGVSGWVQIELAQLGDPTTRGPKGADGLYQPVAGLDIHITDFYKYLAKVGGIAPKSVIEIGIFSHSFPFGPILYDTGEDNAHKPLSAERDPDDFDARPKDFNATNFPGYSGMTAALSDKCRFTIWGCSATTHLKFRAREALKAIKAGMAADAFFTVRSDIQDGGTTVFVEEERTSELRHRFMMDLSFRGGTYAAEAAKKLGIEVRAGCPGTGSDPQTIEGIEMLMVDFSTYGTVFDYYHKAFSPEFAETRGKWDKGYVDYHALQSRAAVADPGFSSEYYDLRLQLEKTHFEPAGGAMLIFWHKVIIRHPSSDVTLSQKAIPDLVTVGKKGHLYVLKDKDDTKSEAVYVQEDGSVFEINRDASHKWTVKGAQIH